VLVDRGRVAGVRLASGDELYARTVITSCNVKSVLTTLLPDGALPGRLVRRAEHIPTTGTRASSFKFDLALNGQVTLAEHQARRGDGVDLRTPALCYTTFEDHVAAWEACARGEIAERLPMITIIPTGADPTQAPDGQDTVWSWTGIAAGRPTQPWSEVGAAVAEREIGRAARFLGGLRQLEITRQVMTPTDFASRFRVPDGNVYHVDPTATRFGPLRPAVGFSGFTSPLEGLILSGGGMHPSAGICGVPGKLAAEAALAALRRAPGKRSPAAPSGRKPIAAGPEGVGAGTPFAEADGHPAAATAASTSHEAAG